MRKLTGVHLYIPIGGWRHPPTRIFSAAIDRTGKPCYNEGAFLIEEKHMAKKKGAGGKLQPYDERDGRYIADYTALGTQELRERQIIEIPASAEHPPVEKAFGFNRLDTKHHHRHALEMGFKNMREYEQAAVAFFNSDKGKLYYSASRKRFYRYNERTQWLAVSSHGVIHTFFKRTKKEFEKMRRQDKLQ